MTASPDRRRSLLTAAHSSERCIYCTPGAQYYSKTKPDRIDKQARKDGCRRSRR